jgi:hypothetical protein
MSKKVKMMLAMVVMLSLAGIAQAAPPVDIYFWNWGIAGDWSDPAIWADGANPDHLIPTPTMAGGNQCMLLSLSTSLVTVTAAGGATGQGCGDLLVGYVWGGEVTLRIDAGIDFTVTNYLSIGYASQSGVAAKGVVDLYGTAHSQGLHFAGADVNSSGTLNIYDGAKYTLGSYGCLIGAPWPPPYTVCGTGFVNMKGTGSMVINGNPTGAIEMTSKGHIDIEAGELKVLGDYQTLLQGYINNGWITSHGGQSPRCTLAVTYVDGYTYVKTAGCTCVSFLAEDMNRDCYVDFRDFASLASGWLNCTNPEDANCVQ